jgi:hypothetical protein
VTIQVGSALPIPAVSFQDVPLVLGALALLIAAAFGARSGLRRLRETTR